MMKVYKKFDKLVQSYCPVCQTSDDGDIVMVPIPDTVNNDQVNTQQMHLSCFQELLDLAEYG